ncbi:unnamed protein product [Paramecium pentaurelia]|uniref:Transmembrane protein n=1 Tax=Paramecium pentaurelia TaxID=43138 RepID=A0A8S1WKW0_9CILI|nr:unnamed protein product [Paramecium pentaurelia]
MQIKIKMYMDQLVFLYQQYMCYLQKYLLLNMYQFQSKWYSVLVKNLIQHAELKFMKINQQQLLLMLNVKALLIFVLRLELLAQLFQHFHYKRHKLFYSCFNNQRWSRQIRLGYYYKQSRARGCSYKNGLNDGECNTFLSRCKANGPHCVIGYHILNSLISNSVFNLNFDHVFGLMDNVMTVVKMQ